MSLRVDGLFETHLTVASLDASIPFYRDVLGFELAFGLACSLIDVLAAPDRLRSAGIAPLGFHGEPVDEPVVIGWMPAASVFFTDPDGHLLEFVAMLGDPPRADVGVVSYSKWTGRHRGLDR